ncbi:hypothetical protein A5662_20355 [Mycobacteriaceae bacterium 1482268.1]|nr:hypothetical protein A5662_20355 [Mycobacteriaceae bacterium 1482268.1]
MDLRSYLRFLHRHWHWIAIFTSVGVITATAASLSATPKFAATAELFLVTPGYSSMGSLDTLSTSPYQADVFSQQRALSYVQLATRVDLARRVIDGLGIGLRAEDLADATSASVRPDTVLMNITVKADSASTAKILADAVAAELAKDIRELETPSGTLVPTVDPVVTQPAGTPTRPAEPNIAIYLVLGAACGFLTGVTIAGLLSRRGHVADAREVEAFTGRPAFGGPLGTELMRRAIQVELEDASASVITITGVAASARSSETAGHIAGELAESGRRVVLVETTAYPGETIGLASVIAGEARFSDALQETENPYLFRLGGPGPDDMSALLRSERFRAVVNALRESFDLVVFDSPDCGQWAESAVLAEVVDSIVIVVSEKTRRRDLVRVSQIIDDRHVQLLGSIVSSPSSGRPVRENPSTTTVLMQEAR